MLSLPTIPSTGSTVPKVSVPGVKVYTSKGIVYAYDRLTGTRITPPHAIGTPEWWRALETAREKAKPKDEPQAGSWGAIATEYRAGQHFRSVIAPRTRADYHKVFDYLRHFHDDPVTKWDGPYLVKLRDRAHASRGRRFANYVLAVVSIVFNHARERGLAIPNPVADVRKVRRMKSEARANRPWADEEWEAVIAAAPPVLLAPILLGGVLGYRQGEALAVRRDTWNRTTGVLTRVSAKSGKIVRVPAPTAVDAALCALPPHTATTLLVNSHGRPWREDGFRGSFFRLVRTLEADGRVAKGLTFHGLRHTAATRLRRLGFDTRTIADMLGQETEGMAAHYSREADLEPKLRGVVQRLDRENRKRTRNV